MPCVIVEKTFDSKLLTGITALRNLQLVSVPSICPFTLNSLDAVRNQVCLCSTDLYFISCKGFTETFN